MVEILAEHRAGREGSLVRKLDENWVSERTLLEISATHKSLAMKTCETDDRSCNIFLTKQPRCKSKQTKTNKNKPNRQTKKQNQRYGCTQVIGEKVKRRALTLFFGCQLLGYVSRAVRPQLQRCEKDNFTFVKATKTFTIIGQNNERIDQTNSKTN